MRRNITLLVFAAVCAGVLVAIPADTEAGIFRRRGGHCRPTCCPPCPTVCQPAELAPLPPGVRTIVSPKGVTYRLIPSGDRGREDPELVLPPSLTAKPAGPDDWNGHSRQA